MIPSQANARQAAELLLAHLKQLSTQMETMQLHDPNRLQDVLRQYNHTLQSPLPAPGLAAEIRDEWVPALWYSSLIFTLMGTMLTLCIKHWLMTCTFFPSYYDPDPPEALRDAERLQELRPSDARKAEMRRTRKESLSKTERTKWALPYLMYSAVAMFIFGLLAKLGSVLWLVYFPPA